MKKLLLTLCFLLVTSSVHAALCDNLISYWSLNDAGTWADSVVATGNDLSTNGTVPAGTGHVYANAATFNGNQNNFLSRTSDASLQMGAGVHFTIIFWFNPADIVTAGGIYGKWGSVGNEQYIIYISTSNAGKLTFYVSADNHTPVNVDSTVALSLSTWYMAKASYDGVNIAISINNGTDNTTAFSTDVYPGGTPLIIGRDNSTTAFNGLVGPAMFWKRVLTPTEVGTVYNSGAGLTYLNMCFPSSGHNLTLTGVGK